MVYADSTVQLSTLCCDIPYWTRVDRMRTESRQLLATRDIDAYPSGCTTTTALLNGTGSRGGAKLD